MERAATFGFQLIRSISTTSCTCGKRNFRKFPLYNKRGTRLFKASQSVNPHPNVPIYNYGVRPIGYKQDDQFVPIPQMIPELIVPDLTGFKLKPYVSYRVDNIEQPPMTPEELFGLVYVPKISDDFKNGKLGPDNMPLEPSADEKRTQDEAKEQVSKIQSDVI